MREDQSLNARTNRLRLASICLFAALLGGCGANAPSARDDQNSGGRAGTSGGGGDRGAPAGSGGAGGAKAGGSGGAPADGAHPVDDASDDAESVATPDGGSDDSALVPPPPVGPIAIPTSYPTGTGSAGVAQGPSGKLVYTFDTSGDTVPDFSNVGYQGGGVKIPTVRVVTTLAPLPGENDASARIQAAIDALA
jgi:hypothetical protein